MAEMTPDYEIGDDVMYASDQRSVVENVSARGYQLSTPATSFLYLLIRYVYVYLAIYQ